MSADARSRAAEVLEVPADADAAAAAAAFLATLPGAGLVPPGRTVAALNTLLGTAVPDDGEANLLAEVEEFAGRYWSLAPADRLSTWLRLRDRSPDGAATTRLRALQAGLSVDTGPQADGTAEEVAALSRELFLLPARERAVRRNGWLLANAARHAELVRAAAESARTQPGLTALDPVLFARLTSQFDAPAFAEAAEAEPLPTSTRGPSKPIEVGLGDHIDIASHAAVPSGSRRSGGSASGVPWPAAWVVGFGVLMLIRLMVSVAGSGTRSDSAPTHKYTPPPAMRDTPKYPPPPALRAWFTHAEVEAFKQYEQNPEFRPPRRYPEWLAAGRPEAIPAAPVGPPKR